LEGPGLNWAQPGWRKGDDLSGREVKWVIGASHLGEKVGRARDRDRTGWAFDWQLLVSRKELLDTSKPSLARQSPAHVAKSREENGEDSNWRKKIPSRRAAGGGRTCEGQGKSKKVASPPKPKKI